MIKDVLYLEVCRSVDEAISSGTYKAEEKSPYRTGAVRGCEKKRR
jgi:hypothetical protein